MCILAKVLTIALLPLVWFFYRWYAILCLYRWVCCKLCYSGWACHCPLCSWLSYFVWIGDIPYFHHYCNDMPYFCKLNWWSIPQISDLLVNNTAIWCMIQTYWWMTQVYRWVTQAYWTIQWIGEQFKPISVHKCVLLVRNSAAWENVLSHVVMTVTCK